MPSEKVLLEIMEKTVATLESNKNAVVSIIHNLRNEHEKKKHELAKIKAELPETFNLVKHLSVLDKQLRSKLAEASNDFSNQGHKHLKDVFDQANAIHERYLKACEAEHLLICRRDALEVDLRHSQFHIEQAECMAQQLIVSLSYLQTGIEQLNEVPEEEDEHRPPASLYHYLAFLKCVENEKSRIARDLHDGPAQQIAAAQMRVDFCKTLIQQNLEQGLMVLDHLKGDLAFALTEVREILFNLNPAPLDKLGLKHSIQNMLCSILGENIHTNFYYEIHTTSLSVSWQTTIYRILQELINNIKKHAHATHVVLRLSESDNFIYIHLMDNGKGFNIPKDLETFGLENKSYGLTNVTTRVHELDGNLKISSSKDKGTLFKIQLPILSY